MRALKLTLGLAALVALVAQPLTAQAQRTVPPDNSAATQYTETYPTAGGDSPTGDGRAPSPQRTLGTGNAKRLEALGSEGQAAAALAATTAPVKTAEERGVSRPGAARSEGGADASAPQPDGASALNQVIEQATGSSSSGQMGLLLPLIVLAAIACSAAHLWRRHRAISR
jgi:hypothetical protein